MTNNHGGKRPNAGRKSSDGATDLKLLQVYVTQDDVNTAVEVGKGNKSLGVRKALHEMRANNWSDEDMANAEARFANRGKNGK